MKRLPVLSLVTLAMVCTAACSNEEPARQADAPVASSSPAASAAEGSLPKIPILPGYKYYVGGPVMKQDKYDRYRLHRFDGEVAQPPSRGMLFGAKQDGDQLEYKVWGNGVLLGFHRGVMRDGVFWEEYAEGYRQGKLIARERRTNDDETQRSKVVTEDIDPETGEVIRTRERSESYVPPATDLDDDDEDDDEQPAGKADAPAPAAGDAAHP